MFVFLNVFSNDKIKGNYIIQKKKVLKSIINLKNLLYLSIYMTDFDLNRHRLFQFFVCFVTRKNTILCAKGSFFTKCLEKWNLYSCFAHN